MINENFCIQPWIHLSSWNDGNVPLCCIATPEKGLNFNFQSPIQIWNSQQFKTARLKFLAGEKLSQCNTCWKEEASGIKSHRIIENEIWQKYLGNDYIETLISHTQPDGHLEDLPLTLDLRIGNTCNLTCVMCRPRDSSKWLNDSKKISEIASRPIVKEDWQFKSVSIRHTEIFDWFLRENVQNDFTKMIKNIRHIIFGGGEPLLLKEHEQFLEMLINNNVAKNIHLRYHTNATVLSSKFINLWSCFADVELLLSIDDFGSRNEYVRYPAEWNTIYKNLQILDLTPDNIRINILATVHALNIFNLPDYAESLLNCNWKKICVRKNNLFSVGTVHWPKYMSTKVLPKQIKDKIVEKWNKHAHLKKYKIWTERIIPQLDYMNSSDESYMFDDLVDYINSLDTIRPIKFSDVYSEYATLLNNIKK